MNFQRKIFIEKKKGSRIYLPQVKGFLNRVYEIRDLQGRIKPVPWKAFNRKFTLESIVFGKNTWNLTGGSSLEIVHVLYLVRIKH